MKYLSTGQFAKLCGIKKDTLLFYDREGLLVPRHVSEKGYRRYDVGQFYEFDMIRMFKDTGSSLKEIRSFMQEPDPESLLEHLEKKKDLLRRERQRLAAREKLLGANMALAREALHATYGVLELVEMEEERLEVVAISHEEQATEESYISLFAELAGRFEEQGKPAPMPYGFLTEKKNIPLGDYLADYFFCGASRGTREENLCIRPAGCYARLYHRGNAASHADACQRMTDAISRNGWTVSGALFGYDLASYIVSSSTEEYVAKYCVGVTASLL